MKRWHWIVLAVLALLSAVLAYLDDPNHFPGYYLVFGLAGALFFAGFAKFVLKKLLMRKEDYYDT